ncbi:hypothetical protein B0H13DRAFT_2345855 [Mycena leptocephala]|nr:hypothetical protein B0H13DRAFT_2345855 [Mycena leptocephala]
MARAPPIGLDSIAAPIPWRPTTKMKACDLAKDDDFLTHILVEKLSTGAVPLLVHKMDPACSFPHTDTDQILAIVRRLAVLTPTQAVDELLALPPVRHYVEQYSPEQINAFATHASRYFGLYHPSSCIEIAHTSRYSHRTGKSELCILATRILSPGTVITALKGSMAPLTDDDNMRFTHTDVRNSDTPKDFSIIHSPQMNKDYLFLGPARFHDCDNNCELSREGKHITFRVLRSIAIGEEITVHYGDGYFGRANRHCLCSSCEKAGRGGYAPNYIKGDPPMNSESDLDSDPCEPKSDNEQETLVLNEKRPRRRVYPLPSALTPLSPAGPPRLANLRTHQRHTRGSAGTRSASRGASIDTGGSLLLRSSHSPPSPGGLFNTRRNQPRDLGRRRLLIDCVLIVRPSRLPVDAPVKRGETPAPGNNHTTSRYFHGLSATSHRATTDIPWSEGEVETLLSKLPPNHSNGLQLSDINKISVCLLNKVSSASGLITLA